LDNLNGAKCTAGRKTKKHGLEHMHLIAFQTN